MLSQFGTNLLFKSGNDFVHHSVNLLVLQCLFIVLQDDAYGIGFFACLEVLTLVDVEQAHTAQEFALGAVNHFFNVGHCHRLVDEQSEVALHGLRLRQVGESYFLFQCHFHQSVPIQLGEEHILLHIGFFEDSFFHYSHFAYVLAATIVDGQCGGENIA